MKINKKLLMAALASAVIVSAPQAKTYADTQTDDTQAVTEKLIDDQIATAQQPAEQNNSEKVNAEGKQSQQESSKLKSEKETNSKKSGFGSQALNHPAQATAVSNVGNNANNSGLELGEEKQPEAVQAGETGTEEENKTDTPDQKSDDFNYAKDEKNVGNYRDTQLEQGNGPAFESNEPSMDMKDGFRYNTLEPGTESPDKKKWGLEIEIDKEKGQRTYTDFGFTNSGLMGGVLGTGNVPAKSPEDGALADGFKTPNYKASTEIIISGSRQQINLNGFATKEDLEHINNTKNNNTTMAWEGHYLKDNTTAPFATVGESATFNFTVNPWPNENDMLAPLKLSGNYREKVFVKGQTIDTGVTVENLDDNARERLVGQVYSSVTGDIVPEAKAYIDKNGQIKIKLPAGAVNEDGTINKNSIFYKDPAFRGLTSLDVKFFARPRTKAEFEGVVNQSNSKTEGEAQYVGTDAGTATIKHKGQDVVIDKQGIARYDHYNLIGSLNLQLDDTRYYDQDFAHHDNEKKTTTEVKEDELTDILPGKDFTVDMFKPEKEAPHQKTGDEMNAAQSNGEAVGEFNTSSLDEKNKALAEKEGVKYEDFIKEDKYKNKRWEIKTDKNDIAKFTIKAPKSAKSGESVSLNVKYTYTNGSTDRKVFYFVVQDSAYIKPEYKTQVNFPAIEQKSPATIPEDGKKEKPESYSLPDQDEEGNPIQTIEEGKKIFKDDKGNKWAVSIDETTGEVTAKPVDQANFNGGEKLTVPVISHYTDPNDKKNKVTEEATAEFVIKERFNKTPRYNAKAGKTGDELSSDIILDKNDTYNREPGKFSLASDTFVDDKGNTWNVTIDENSGKVTATVPNAEEGKTVDGDLLNVPVIAHYYEKQGDKLVETGTKDVEAQFMAYGTNGKVEKTVEVPFETKVEKDPKLKKGEIKVITEGKKGSKKVTYTIEDSKIVKEEEQELEAPQIREIHVGEGVNDGTHKIEEKVEVAFETEVEFDDSLAPGEKKITQEGEPGEKTRTTTLTIEDGNVTKTEVGDFTETKAPKKRIIKVGRNTEGKVEHKEELPFKYKVEEVDTLKKGEYKIVKPGKVGTKTTTWTIKNSQIDGKPTETIDPAEDAIIQVGKGTNDGTHEVTEKKNIDYKTIIEYDEKLDAGQQEVVKEGNPGEQERTNTLVIKDGKVTETKEGEFNTTKEATDRVVKIGTKPVTKVVEKPFNTEYVYDENLESGKTEEVTPGKNGKVTITTTYDKDQKKVVTSETEEAGQNRVVKIGGKTNGTEKIKEEIPFEVEVRKDPSLKKGEWKYAKDDEGNELKGEKGEQEKTLTIENSKVTNTSEPTVTKKAKNVVILVGEGTNDGTHKVVEKKEIPFETRYEYDENLEAGQREETGGTPGEQERTNTLVIKDGKVEETKEGEFKTTKKPVDKVIKIGIKPIVKEVEKPFETEYIYDENVEMGKEEEVTPGEKGKVTITTSYDKDQNKLVTKEETKDPVKRVVKVGIKPVVKEEQIPEGKTYKHNPELEDGVIRKVKDGTPGKVTITTSFNKETGKIETKVERTEPKDAEYEYGSKTEGKVKVESDLPFEVEIIKDPEMEAGKTETVQEGKLGKKETTITVENSKEVSREEKIIEQPVKKIVKIGTKNVCEIPPVKPEDPTKPGNKDPENPTKPGDKDPENPTKPGDKDPENPTKPGEKDPENPTKPGEKDPENPTKPGEKDPENPGSEKPNEPGTPGENKPNEPGTPGENKPNEPGTPGEKPNEPGTPGENKPNEPGTPGENKPNEPGTPGKTPEENGKTPEENGKTPENNGKTPEENGKTPENNGKTPENNGKTPDNSREDSPNKPNETPKTPETTEQVEGKEKADTPNRKSANKLPKAGSESEIMMLSMSALTTAAGFIGLKKKRKDR
ncbi:LPXTG-motif cell wall anchor domain protein [Finegoldia magna ACS-171-V-Col3]|uniref:G5 domain-containing protein n=1 Tax=Finegoldia magna TaxID=1260 RepID=UPI0001DE4AB3|nr:G5 domain-containing protein [Finegoldia magna]EFK93205.1 LPXTG-motif cell wall anchor domain protein [Finegoldia magna ACS-171-V-Col3]